MDDKDIMENLIPIIEFQDEIQRTPQELINYLQSKVDRIDRLVVFGIIEDEKGTPDSRICHCFKGSKI